MQEIMVSEQQVQLQLQLDEIAIEIKFSDLAQWKRQLHETRLFEGLMQLTKKRFNNGDAEQEGLWINILGDAYMSTMEKFGKRDNLSNEIIPFTKLFWSHFGFAMKNNCRQMPDGKLVELDNPQSKAREGQAKQILRIYARKYNIDDYVLPKHVRSKSVFYDELVNIGVDQEVAEELSQQVFSENYLSSIEDHDMATNEADMLNLLIDKLEVIFTDVSFSDKQKSYVRYFITENIYNNNLQFKYEYQDFIDKAFGEALEKAGDEVKPTEVLADLLGLANDTVRKNLKAAENCIRKYYNND